MASLRPVTTRRAAGLALASVAVWALAAARCAVGAEPPPYAPGEYVQPGCCVTTLGTPTASGQAFTTTAQGANGHSCELSGTVVGRRAVLKSEFSPESCELELGEITGGFALTVTAGRDGCRQYCGARAWFEGDYRRPPAACGPTAMRKTRTAFKQAYQAKRYDTARGLIEPLLAECESWTVWDQRAWIRNDTALAQLRAGAPAQCLETLKGFADEIDLSDQEIVDRYHSPSDIDTAQRLMKAARTNRELCRKALDQPADPSRR